MFRKIILQMQKRKEYLTAPATIIAMIVFIFWLWMGRATMNSRVNKLEEFQSSINMVEIQKDIAEIKTNVAWLTKLMSDLQNNLIIK